MTKVFDVLPEIEKKLINSLADFLKADDGKFHMWEIAVFVPAVNQFIHYLSGLNASLEKKNYITAMSSLRGMIESLAVVIYDGTEKLTEEAYKEFMSKGRLPIWNDKKKKWRKVTNKELVKGLEDKLKINVVEIYDHTNDLLHFSATHMSFLGGANPQEDNEERIAKIHVGSEDEIPPEKVKEIIEYSVELAARLGGCIESGIEEKERRSMRSNQKN